jgi:type I restriction enzyme S subunit
MGALGISSMEGIVSSSYGVYRFRNNSRHDSRYYDYLVRIKELVAEYNRHSKGIHTSRLRMYSDNFFDIVFPLPPLTEQTAIANSLDRKTAQIDEFIALKEKTITLLQEQKTAIINRAVTQGLNPAAPMKDSGIEWLGEIPAHWEVKKFSREVTIQEGPGIMAYDFRETGVPLLRISGMKEKYATLEGCNYLDEIKVKSKWEHFKLKQYDVLISCSASTDLVCEVGEETIGAIPYTGIIRLKPHYSDISKDYLKQFVQSTAYQQQVKLLKAGSTIQHYGPTAKKHLAGAQG